MAAPIPSPTASSRPNAFLSIIVITAGTSPMFITMAMTTRMGVNTMAVIVGSMVKSGTTDDFAPNIFGVSFVAMFDYIGSLFLNALKMIIVPLITSSIIVGVAGIGSGGNLGSLGGKTLLFYATTTLAAILVGESVIAMLPAVALGLGRDDSFAADRHRLRAL